MEIKEFGPPGGVPGAPLDPPMVLLITTLYFEKSSAINA